MSKLKEKGIFSNLGLKVIALLAAFALWFAVMNLQDSIITRTISGIDVEMKNGDVIQESGYLYNVTNGEEVTIVVKGPRSIVENLDVENFKAVADLSQLSVTNSTTISVMTNASVSATDARKLTITPINEYVTLTLEEEMEKIVPVKVITTGTVRNNFQLGSPVPTPNMVTVTGPESVLETIVEARAVVDVSGSESEVDKNVTIGVVDGYGSAVEKDNITLSTNTVSINIPVYSTKEIPVNVSTVGNPATGYGVRELNYDPETVIVAGENEALSLLDEVNISDISISDATDNIEKNIDVSSYLPEGIFLADDSATEVVVSVSIEATNEKEINISGSDITLNGKSADLEYQVITGESKKITIMGFEEDIADVDVSALKPHIDVTDLTVGDHALQISFAEADKYEIKGTYSVVVKISKKTEKEDTD